jgi:hypothetical protein
VSAGRPQAAPALPKALRRTCTGLYRPPGPLASAGLAVVVVVRGSGCSLRPKRDSNESRDRYVSMAVMRAAAKPRTGGLSSEYLHARPTRRSVWIAWVSLPLQSVHAYRPSSHRGSLRIACRCASLQLMHHAECCVR